VSRRGRWEYLRKINKRYREADWEGRSRILDEFCEVAGYHWKYAPRLLNGPEPGEQPKPRRHRRPRYSSRAVSALEAIWTPAGYPWSVRLKALLPTWMPWARRLAPEVERDDHFI